MSFFEKHFKLDEANSLIPHIRTIFSKIHRLMNIADPGGPTLQRMKTPGHANGHAGFGGRSFQDPEVLVSMLAGLKDSDRNQLIRDLLDDLMNRGIVIQDIQRGLIDFPGYREDNEVLLCYELNDGPEIMTWHGIHDGFSGRQPIDSLIR